MGQCWFCGVTIDQPFSCAVCKKDYCQIHADPSTHDCPGTPIVEIAPMPASSYVGPVNSTPTPLNQPLNQSGYAPSEEELARSTQDGSYEWHGKTEIPDNAFDPESGVEIPGIFWPKGSEGAHLIIGGLLIFVFGYLTFVGLTSFAAAGASLGIPQVEVWHVVLLASIFAGSFLGHEFGHRQVAKHHKMQTKFRLFTFGIVITIVSVVMAFFGLPGFGFPGAVVVIGLEAISRETGECKVAGPLVNLVLGGILFFLGLFGNLGFPLNFVLYYASYFNFQLGVFNMIPVGALDGRNIIKWNPKIWVVVMILLGGFLGYVIWSLSANNGAFIIENFVFK